ncbi:hypothetical protein PRZ48_014454 [Zasmidium cellare]|uniref:SNF7 family protein n=1 Tax=Zasmidium cellare TaxID=395010 RepID=A0ABR0DYZ4_ZASCE|nr:hypothetical protein PRZ48_014454 [Zasmidium cellare]
MSELLEFLRTHDEAFRSQSRLASLYSDFRYQRNSNPDGYTANSSAWLRALSSAAKAGLVPSASGAAHGNERFVLNSGEELSRALQTSQFGRPLALGAVIEDAVKQGQLIPLKEFLERAESVYVKRWVRVPSVGDVFKWGLKQLGVLGDGSSGEDRLVRGDFVVIGNVEEAAKRVIDEADQIATSNTSRVFSKAIFNKAFAKEVGVDKLSQRDLDVLLLHLRRDRNAVAYDAVSGVVKFKAPGEAKPASITNEDKSIAALRTLISTTEPQIEQLTARIAQLDITARTAVANKQVSAAKTALRQKKLADTTLQQRTATLAQLEDVYAKIEQAADQVEIVKVMEASGQTLKSLNAQTGGVEKVQDVMDGLKDEMMNVDEIGQAINDVSAGEMDDVEVENELEALEKAEKEKLEAKERAEREKREAEEAEKTKARLAELENVGKEVEQKQDEATTAQEAEKATA